MADWHNFVLAFSLRRLRQEGRNSDSTVRFMPTLLFFEKTSLTCHAVSGFAPIFLLRQPQERLDQPLRTWITSAATESCHRSSAVPAGRWSSFSGRPPIGHRRTAVTSTPTLHVSRGVNLPWKFWGWWMSGKLSDSDVCAMNWMNEWLVAIVLRRITHVKLWPPAQYSVMKHK